MAWTGQSQAQYGDIWRLDSHVLDVHPLVRLQTHFCNSDLAIEGPTEHALEAYWVARSECSALRLGFASMILRPTRRKLLLLQADYITGRCHTPSLSVVVGYPIVSDVWHSSVLWRLLSCRLVSFMNAVGTHLVKGLVR